MPTADELRDRIATLEARLHSLALDKTFTEAELNLCRDHLGVLEGTDGRNAQVREPVETPIECSRAVAISAGLTATNGTQTESRWAAIAAGLTDPIIANLLKVGRSTVNAWHLGKKGIPRRHANALAVRERPIPLDSWARVID